MDVIASVVGWLVDPDHWVGPNGIPYRVAQHVGISAAGVAIALALALPLGLYIGHTGRGRAVAIRLATFGRAIPSLAVIAIIVPFSQKLGTSLAYFNLYPTVIAMVALAVPPILVNAYAGVAEVDRELVESARGMGMTERQILRGVEIPVALPVIIGGLRSASVQVIATTTLGAIYGLGALGGYIVEGNAQDDVAKTYAGVVLVAILALAAEGGLAFIQRRLTAGGQAEGAREVSPA